MQADGQIDARRALAVGAPVPDTSSPPPKTAPSVGAPTTAAVLAKGAGDAALTVPSKACAVASSALVLPESGTPAIP